MRKSIFDIVSGSISMDNETERILTMAEEEYTLCVDGFYHKNLFDFVDEYCFDSWEHRGHFIGIDDYLRALDFDTLKRNATHNVEALLTLIELIYNFWNLSNQKFYVDKKGYRLQWSGNYYHLKNVMDDILQQYNHIAHASDDNRILVIEDKTEVTAVAERLSPALSFSVIKYNHRSLQGEIDFKKSILLSLGAELEPKRKELQAINKKLSDDIFFMLNNMDIRHNNRSKKDNTKYKEYVAKMTKKQLEKWYDELYQMILLAFLLLDNVDRSTKIEELKDKISGGNGNG